jgi:predicted  nucleic acid-binding Zn-ribbon protein
MPAWCGLLPLKETFMRKLAYLCAAVLFAAGCGKKEVDISAVKTPEDFVDAQIALSEQGLELIKKITDKASAEKHKSEVEALMKKFEELEKKGKELKLKAEDIKKAYEAKKDKIEKLEKDMRAQKERVDKSEEIKKALGDAFK